MYNYILKRLLLIFPTLFGSAIFVFFLLRAIPGDICELRLGGTGGFVDPEAVKVCSAELGLDRPMLVQRGHQGLKGTTCIKNVIDQQHVTSGQIG